MDSQLKDILDGTVAKTPKSPMRTSTVVRENIKWNEDAFFKRQKCVQASESIFHPDPESSISVLNEVTNVFQDSSQKPMFNLNDASYVSEGANSSLGILNLNYLSDIGDISLSESLKNQKFKRNQNPELSTEGKEENVLKNMNFEDDLNNLSAAVLKDNNRTGDCEDDNESDSSSFDIEYDGSNIPELNYDFDVLSQDHSRKDYTSRSNANENESVTSDTLKASLKDSNCNDSNCRSTDFTKDAFSINDMENRKSSVNPRQSIFENIQPSYDSLYHQILTSKNGGSKKNKNAIAPQKIKVSPFLDMSSFEVEPLLHRQNETSFSSEVENARCSENLSVDFCPELISARSSSLKSSLRSGSMFSEVSNMSNYSKHELSTDCNHSQFSAYLENEVLSGSCFQKSASELELNENSETKENSISTNSNLAEKSIQQDLAIHTDLANSDISDIATSSRLGISDSGFFSADAAIEILKKDSEAFEKEHLFEIKDTNKVSSVSNWSPPNQFDVTAPSWFSKTSPTDEQNPSRHISIGTLINARSEELGTLSEDSERERPFFGTNVKTPPKTRPSSKYLGKASTKPDEAGISSSENCFKQFRESALSELLDNISFSDPINIASKITKCMPAAQSLPQTAKFTCTDIPRDRNEYVTKTQNELCQTALNDTEESENTLVRSASSNSLGKQTDIDLSENKTAAIDSIQSMENTLNFSTVDSTSDQESIKTDKSDTCSNCNLSASQQSTPHGFSRPTSSCSSTCHNPVSLQNAFTLQYGCMKYMNSGEEQGQCMLPNNYLLLHGNSAAPCPHVCAQHTMPSNLLSLNAQNSFQPIVQNTVSGTSLSVLPAISHPSLGIEAPTELRFPEKIAIGDSQEMSLTIRNATGVPCYYHISCISAYLNDSTLPLHMSGLSYNKTMPSSSGNTTDIKLVISPKYEGNMIVNLQINAITNSMGQALNSLPAATARTRIEYEAVRPSISLLSKGKETLHMEPVIAGSTFVECITLVNNSEVAVPLRINLTNDTFESQIYFGLKEMNRQKYPATSGPKFLSPKVMLYRLPGSKNKSLPSCLEIPVVFESIKGQVNSAITASIETPTLSEVLAFIRISISAGNAKLVLKDASQNPLRLRTPKGSTLSHSLTVLNDGTIPVVYDLQIDSESDCFSVSPNTLNLHPNQSAIISVTFSPLSTHTVKGSLLAAAEPHGQVFTIAEIIGDVQTGAYPSYRNNPRIFPTQPTRDSANSPFESSNLIECNKKYLAWGGADIGRTIVKTFTMRNPGREAVLAKLFIKDKAQAFQLIDDSSHKTLNFKLSLNGREEREISVTFTPKGVATYSGLLCVKPIVENESTVFSIPLSGYGGAAKIKVLGLPDGEGTGYCLDVDVPSETETIYKNITVYNIGVRAAFVKLLVTYDGLVRNSIENQTVINPSEFVLLENEKKNVLVSVNCMNKDYTSNNENISIIYGDEIMRQRYRRNTKSIFTPNDPNFNINFNVPYDGEDRVPYDSSYVSPKVDSIFYVSLKKLLIHIFFNGQNAGFSRMDFTALSVVQDSFSNLSISSVGSSRRLTIEGHSPPVKESAVKNINRLSLPIPFDDDHLLKTIDTNASLCAITDEVKALNLQTWTVLPEELSLDVESKVNRILLKSYSNVDMRFKVECAIDVITVSPNSGVLSANGEIGLRLTLINHTHNKLYEDYYGCIKISCDGMEKHVSIKVLKRIKNVGPLHQPPSTTMNLSLKSGFLGDSMYMDSTLVGPVDQSICANQTLLVEDFSNLPKLIHLPVTKQGASSEVKLVIQNSKNAVTWNMNPISMVFTEPFDESIDCASSVIEFLPSNGTLKSLETATIMIRFSPTSVAHFSKFFEVCLNYEIGTKQSYNIKVQGEAAADIPTNLNNKSHDSKKKPKNKVKPELSVEKEICEFQSVAPGQKSTTEITIKNMSAQDCKLSIVKPHLPFILKHSLITVRSSKFIRVPVYFKPLKPGSSYESEVKFISENGLELKVKLKGCCST